MVEPPSVEYCLFCVQHWSMCMTKAEWSGWMQAIGAVAALLIAIAVPYVQSTRQRNRLRLGHFETIAADVLLADRQGRTYLRSKVKAPAYRLPLVGLANAVPSLLATGDLKGSESGAITQFYVDAVSFNYCLDLIGRLRAEQGDWHQEVSRIEAKARHLVSGNSPSRYDEVMVVLRRHMPRSSLERLHLEDDDL